MTFCFICNLYKNKTRPNTLHMLLVLGTIDLISIYITEMRTGKQFRHNSRGTIKNQFRNLSTLDARSIRALRRTLELKSDTTNRHLCQSFLSKITQFGSVQDDRSSVKWFRFYLNGMFEVYTECVTRPIGEEFSIVFGQHTSGTSKFNFDIVIGSSVGRAVQSKPNDENTFIYTKLNAITPTSVAPLIITIRWRLKSMTDLQEKVE